MITFPSSFQFFHFAFPFPLLSFKSVYSFTCDGGLVFLSFFSLSLQLMFSLFSPFSSVYRPNLSSLSSPFPHTFRLCSLFIVSFACPLPSTLILSFPFPQYSPRIPSNLISFFLLPIRPFPSPNLFFYPSILFFHPLCHSISLLHPFMIFPSYFFHILYP